MDHQNSMKLQGLGGASNVPIGAESVRLRAGALPALALSVTATGQAVRCSLFAPSLA